MPCGYPVRGGSSVTGVVAGPVTGVLPCPSLSCGADRLVLAGVSGVAGTLADTDACAALSTAGGPASIHHVHTAGAKAAFVTGEKQH